MSMYDSFTGAYKGLFRFVWYSFLAVGAVVVTVGLAFLGFGIDFGNAFGHGEQTMYMFVLPFGFVVLLVYAVHAANKRRRAKRTAAQEASIRQSIVREHQYGATPPQQVVYILKQKGPQTSRQLAVACNVSEEDMIAITRSLLSEQLISQTIQDGQAYLAANGQ